ncbi:MAG: hypothetical protein ABW075_04435 [Aeromicrobium sp.]
MLLLQRFPGVIGVMAITTIVTAAGCSSEESPPAGPSASSAASRAGCPAGDEVRTADELEDRLAEAEPGDVIALAPGSYTGQFVVDRPGAADAPILLCGDPTAVLDAAGAGDGYALHLDGVQHWRVEGITLRRGAKGLVLDGSSDNEIVDIVVEQTGEEAVHLRRHSSRNLVQGIHVVSAGSSRREIGEGIYVGSAESNWCTLTDCEPDRSDDNEIIDNLVEGTTAEPIDVKEGTSGGVLRGNRLDGSSATEADSLIDLKGNGWTVEGTTGAASPGDGVAVFEILSGWGEANVLRDNSFAVPSDAFAVQIFGDARSNGNVVECSNIVTGGYGRTSNVDCSS